MPQGCRGAYKNYYRLQLDSCMAGVESPYNESKGKVCVRTEENCRDVRYTGFPQS